MDQRTFEMDFFHSLFYSFVALDVRFCWYIYYESEKPNENIKKNEANQAKQKHSKESENKPKKINRKSN